MSDKQKNVLMICVDQWPGGCCTARAPGRDDPPRWISWPRRHPLCPLLQHLPCVHPGAPQPDDGPFRPPRTATGCTPTACPCRTCRRWRRRSETPGTRPSPWASCTCTRSATASALTMCSCRRRAATSSAWWTTIRSGWANRATTGEEFGHMMGKQQLLHPPLAPAGAHAPNRMGHAPDDPPDPAQRPHAPGLLLHFLSVPAPAACAAAGISGPVRARGHRRAAVRRGLAGRRRDPALPARAGRSLYGEGHPAGAPARSTRSARSSTTRSAA